MKYIYNIIEEIKNEPSSNKKLEILDKYKYHKQLKEVLYYTYNPLINYYIKDYEELDIEVEDDLDFELIKKYLEEIASRKYTGNAAREFLKELTGFLSKKSKVILRNIIERDQKCGISIKSINKVFKDFISCIGYMRCSTFSKIDNIYYPAIIQKKLDGMFVNVIIKDGDIKFFTRSGLEFYTTCLKEELLHIFEEFRIDNVCLHGEFLIEGLDGKESESRKVGNGMITSLIKKEQTLETLNKKLIESEGSSRFTKISSEIIHKLKEYEETNNRLKVVFWDIVDYYEWESGFSKTTYQERFERLKRIKETSHVKLVDYKIVNNLEEALKFYNEMIEQGYEGSVIKNLSCRWKDHTSTDMVKIKSEKICELKIIGIEEGNGKFKGGCGGFICESSDSLLTVVVGSGLSDSERGFERIDNFDSSKGLKIIDGFSANNYINSIISVKFNEIIKSESKNTYSLFLPRFEGFRIDKTKADTLEYIKAL